MPGWGNTQFYFTHVTWRTWLESDRRALCAAARSIAVQVMVSRLGCFSSVFWRDSFSRIFDNPFPWNYTNVGCVSNSTIFTQQFTHHVFMTNHAEKCNGPHGLLLKIMKKTANICEYQLQWHSCTTMYLTLLYAVILRLHLELFGYHSEPYLYW